MNEDQTSNPSAVGGSAAAGTRGANVIAYSSPLSSPRSSATRNSVFFSRHLREISVAGAYGLLLLALLIWRHSFFRVQFGVTGVSMVPVLVTAVGMTLVILARQIDISVGSLFSVCAVVAALAAKAGVPMPLVAVAAVVAGAVLGAINGALVAFAGLPSIVTTLATMVILRESLRLAREGAAVRDLPPTFQWFGLSQAGGRLALGGFAVVVFVGIAWAMRWLAAGRAVYAVGSDPEAARLAGIRPRRVVFFVFVLMGALAGLAALLQAVRFPQVDTNVGLGLELKVIAAVVVGGTAVTGGRGTLLGTLLGVALLVTIGPALVFLGIRPEWESALQGTIILLAVASDALKRRAR